MSKKIVFLSYTPPLKVKGSGLSVLLYNIISAIDKFNVGVITFCGDAYVESEEIKKDNESLKLGTIVCDTWFSPLYKIKGARFFKSILFTIAFIVNLLRIGKKINQNDTVVIEVIGASAKPLWKYLLLKALFKKARYGLYIVDDLELINLKYNNRLENYLIKKHLAKAVKKSDFLITISYGLRDLYKNKYNKQSLVLPPHYAQVKPLAKKGVGKEFTFLFTGGLNFLYNESLLKFASVIDEINSKGTLLPKLKLQVQTYSPVSAFNELFLNSSNVVYSTVINRDELLNTYNNCNCFIVPYSFSLDDKQIVETSFPQKVAEIIQYGKPILCFGPNYSSVVQFFKNNGLSYICDKPDRERIIEVVQSIINDYQNFDESSYLRAYDSFLSKNMVNDVFQSITK